MGNTLKKLQFALTGRVQGGIVLYRNTSTYFPVNN